MASGDLGRRRIVGARHRGVTVTKSRAGSVALGGEVGGLGADYKVWTITGRAFWPF